MKAELICELVGKEQLQGVGELVTETGGTCQRSVTDLDKEDGTMVRIDSRRPRMVCLAVWFISGLQEPTLCLVHSQSSINTVG